LRIPYQPSQAENSSLKILDDENVTVLKPGKSATFGFGGKELGG
jgi:hypothetical protein